MKTDLIKNIIKENNGIITAREIKSHNIDSWYLTDMIRKGELERVSRGIYFDPTFNNFDELFFYNNSTENVFILIRPHCYYTD